jgi:hypothetical protein
MTASLPGAAGFAMVAALLAAPGRTKTSDERYYSDGVGSATSMDTVAPAVNQTPGDEDNDS